MRLFLLSLLILSVWAADLPADVQKAIDKSEATIAKARLDLIKDLTKLQDTYTKKGDLNNAVAIKGKIDETTKLLPGLLGDDKVVAAAFIGNWSSSGGGGVFTINEDGGASFAGAGLRPNKGTWKIEKSVVVLIWEDTMYMKPKCYLTAKGKDHLAVVIKNNDDSISSREEWSRVK